MTADISALGPILARVKATPAGLKGDEWIAAAAPDASAAERRALIEALAAMPEPVFTRDPQRVRALQARLKADGLAAFLVPRADAHQGEYIMARAERLKWLTGFTGSAGLAIVTPEAAALFIDGRYTIQAPAETDASVVECRHFKKPPATEWLAERLKAGDRVGFDPAVTAMKEAERWRQAVEAKGAHLVALDHNPIDALWADQPGDPFAAILSYPDDRAGVSSADKRAALGAELKRRGVAACVINQLDSIAWALNVRGGDTPSTPLVQSFLILRDDGTATWFVDRAKFTEGLAAHLGNAITVRPIERFEEGLSDLAGRSVSLEPETATALVAARLTAAGATIQEGPDPATLPKARKNPVELTGTRAAHRRDGAALTRFLHWFDRSAQGLDETQIMARLEETRGQDPLYRGASFTTIAAAGPNGAIAHYRAHPDTARRLEAGSFVVLDSGAQYLDGTTDVTRTLPVGRVSPRLKRHFTLVLKGHIAVATAKFPKGVNGVPIDALARQHLWRAGLDFDHGTGHGVGAYLGVHEGPARLSPLATAPLEPGMILSNEPGFYAEGSHGIRIENLIVVRDAKAKGFLEFETITFAPIDRRAILVSLLTPEERAWINAYHQAVRRRIGPLLDGADKAWMLKMTAAL